MNLPGTPDAAALRQAALAYAACGWQVLPLWWPAATGRCACGMPDCDSAGKHPIHRLVPHGLHDASSRLDTVARWWQSAPCANLGIRTGAASGLVVVDVDGRAGRLALRALVASRPRLQVCWARTGSGWHAYFAHPDTPVPNSARRLGEGLDVRGDGGYVVAPPSRHASGRLYRWVGEEEAFAAAIGDADHLSPMPAWLVELVTARPAAESRRQVLLHSDQAAAYVTAAVASEAREVAQAPPGQRNHRLNCAAFRLGQLVGAGLLEEGIAAAALVDAGLAAGPGEWKIRSTVRRGLQAGMHHPRQIRLHRPR
jgi:hypothetical protein